MVCLSTDKGVYPVNAMGMSKVLLEKAVQAFARNNLQSSIVVSLTRHGNVPYSRGSVIPLFTSQLKSGKPLTLTGPRMTRFLVTFAKSVDLVQRGFLHGNSGDLLIRKAPACSVDTHTMAPAVAGPFGFDEPEVDRIGWRHGETLHETRLSSGEVAQAEDQGEHYQVPLDAPSLEYEIFVDEGEDHSPDLKDYTSPNAAQMNVEQTKALLVPEVQQLLGVAP